MKKFISILILQAFIITSIMGPCPVHAQGFVLPPPGQMVALSPAFSPVVLKGIKLDPKNPFSFHFYVDTGDHPVGAIINRPNLKNESAKLIKYFLASLTIPEKDLWVNLSPRRINEIVLGKRRITADTALRLGIYFKTSPQFWMNLQTSYDLDIELDEVGNRISKEVHACSLN